MNRMLIALACIPLSGSLLSACSEKQSPEAAREKPQAPVFFDDFSYPNLDAMRENGWRVRTESGHPGIEGARWSADGISFLDDTGQPGNTLLRMTSATDGSGENTDHTQICHQRKYLAGTYAARVYFRDAPSTGPDGDQVIETFYTISPLKAPMDPDYSEMDFEYLPNGGWGEKDHGIFATSWETFKLDPFTKDNEYDVKQGSLAGWHTLVLQVGDNRIRYFVDGKQFAEHGEHVYPEAPMSINFNLWFTQEGLNGSTERRVYQEDVDWVFHRQDKILSPAQVQRAVERLRADRVAHTDTVPDWTPKLDSPCGL